MIVTHPPFDTAWDVLTAPHDFLRVDRFVRWFARSKDGDTLGGISLSPENLRATVGPLNRSGYDIFAHLNPTHPRITRRANTEDSLAWAFMLVDIDPLDGTPDPDEVVAATHIPLRSLEAVVRPGWRFAPTIVYTGRGAHLWVRFRPRQDVEWWRIGDAQREILRKLTPPPGYRIDPLGDMARIVRLPGTINHKTGRMAELITPGQFEPPSMTNHVIAFAREIARPQGAPESFDLDWKDVKDELTDRARRFLDVGAPEGVRHETCWHVCRALYEKGVKKISAADALDWGNMASAKRLTPREIWGIVEQVYGKGDR